MVLIQQKEKKMKNSGQSDKKWIKLKFNFPRPCVKRNDLGKLTGGLLNPKTIRNLDSQGIGIKGKFLIGPRTVAYPTDAVIDFIAERFSQNNEGQSCEVCND